MKKIIERLLIFIIGLPAVYAIVILLPYRNNLALNIVTVFFSAMGAVEFSAMLEKKNIFISKIESFILGAVIPLAFTLAVSARLPIEIMVPILPMVCAMWILLSKVFSKSSEIEAITGQIIGKFALFIYPGLFIFWLVIMSGFEKPQAILLFLFITFGNDSAAWLFGSLFGKNNKGIIPVSPNKSIAGFAGGIFGSVIVAVGATLIFPGIFYLAPKELLLELGISPHSMILKAAILGLCTGIAASLGDLAESAIKRSCDCKDSGNFMLGRGGVLDSIDSIAFAAPVFFFLFLFLFS